MEQNIFGAVGIGIGLLIYPFFFLVGLRRGWQKDARALPWLLYPWLYFIVFAISNPLVFRWYLTPPLPPYFLGILLGMDQIFGAVFRLRQPGPAWRAAVVSVLVIAWPLTLSMSEWRLHPDHAADRPAPAMAFIELELLYRQAAEIAAPRLDSQSVLAAGDVGVLGFYTPAKILDTVGLNSPETAAYYPLPADLYEINYAVAPELILDYQPDLVILLEVYGRRGLFRDQRFLSSYQLVETLETDLYGSRGLLIYERTR